MWPYWVFVSLAVFGVLWEILRDHKRRASGLIIFAALIGLGVWGFVADQRSQHEQNNRKEAVLRAKAEQTQQSISQFAGRYNAVTDWRTAFRSKTLTDVIYSAEIAPVFVRTDGRPLLFIVSLRDVTGDGDHYVIHLDGSINFHSEFRLLLESAADQAKLLMSYPRDSENRYAVVAKIQSVDSAEKQILDPEGEARVKSISLARGLCVDVMALGPYLGDVDEILSTFGDH